MPNTIPQGYPWPGPTDPNSADMAAALEALARAVDLDVQSIADGTQQPQAVMLSRNSAQPIPTGATPTGITYTDVPFNNSDIRVIVDPATGNVSMLNADPGLWFFAARVTMPQSSAAMHAVLTSSANVIGRTSHNSGPGGAIQLTVSGVAPVTSLFTVAYTVAHNAAGTLVSSAAAMLAFRIAT